MHSLNNLHQRLLKVGHVIKKLVCGILNLTKVAQSTDPVLQWHLRMSDSAKFYWSGRHPHLRDARTLLLSTYIYNLLKEGLASHII